MMKGTMEEMLDNMDKVVTKYRSILQREYDDKRDPIVSKDKVWFNGIEDEGCETFALDFPGEDFCKTKRQPYDIAVCECLLIAKAHYGSHMDLSSDGFWGSELDENWPEAIKEVESMGYVVKATPKKVDEYRTKWAVEVSIKP
jgi:hypothetical protein